MKLRIAEDVTGKAFSPALFPRCLNLKYATNSDRKMVLGAWPLPVNGKVDAYRYKKL